MLAGLIGAASNVGFLLIAVVGLGLSQFIEGAAEDFLRSTGMSEDWVTKLIGADQSGWRLLMFIGATPALLTVFVRMFVPESKLWQHAAAACPKARVRRHLRTRHPPQNDSRHLPGRHGTDRHLGLDPMGHALGQQARQRHRLVPRRPPRPRRSAWRSAQSSARWAPPFSPNGSAAANRTSCCAWLRCWCALFVSLAAALSRHGRLARKDRSESLFLWRRAKPSIGSSCSWPGLAGCVTASFYGWLPLYLPELFPTRIRATGQGFAFNFGRVLAAVGALQGGQLLDYFHEDYARMGGIMSLVYLAGMVLIWFCPETKGQPLPD